MSKSSEGIYKKAISPILKYLPSEEMHIAARELFHIMEQSETTITILKKIILKNGKRYTNKMLNTSIDGLKLDNPVMVGAGWDKQGRAIKALYQLGFSAIEVGTVLEKEQYGNAKPRQFMVSSGVALNRLGFNFVGGVDEVAKSLKKYKKDKIPIGISIGINNTVKHEHAAEKHAIVASKMIRIASYFTINVSSPNTKNLRKLQGKNHLSTIVKAVQKEIKSSNRKIPLFVKIAPDLPLEEINDVIDVVQKNKCAGIVATNTTINKRIKAKYKKQNEQGGISGDDKDFRKMSTDTIRHIRKKTKGKIDIIGVGGVKDGQTALEKILAGASAIQVVTAIRGEGPQVAEKINREIVDWMNQNKVKAINEIIGKEDEFTT